MFGMIMAMTMVRIMAVSMMRIVAMMAAVVMLVASTLPRSKRNLGFPLIFLGRMLEMFMTMFVKKIVAVAMTMLIVVVVVKFVAVIMMLVVNVMSVIMRVIFIHPSKVPEVMAMLYLNVVMVVIQSSYQCETEKGKENNERLQIHVLEVRHYQQLTASAF